MTSVVIHCCKSGTNPIIFFSHLNLVTIYQRSVYNTDKKILQTWLMNLSSHSNKLNYFKTLVN